MSELSSLPKAPKPRHHRTHQVLRMSSPELVKHATRRQHGSEATRHRSTSTTSCGFGDCRYCYRTRTPPPGETRRSGHDVKLREGMEKGERGDGKKKARSSRGNVHGAVKRTTRPRDRHRGRARGRSQVRKSSTRPHCQVRNSSARPLTSPLVPSSRMASPIPSSYHGSPRPRSSIEHFH